MWSNIYLPALAVLATSVTAQDDGFFSPPKYPSPWAYGAVDSWADAHSKAVAFVSQLTLLEKVNLTTGVGWEGEACVGNTGGVPRLGVRGFCLQDSPLGIRFSDLNSAFPSGMNAAATWSRDLIYARGHAMGVEFGGKGIDVILGPAAGPLGRVPAGGRNWEGFSVDPVLTGVGMMETITGIQDAGVVACAKHYIGNEQEHFREATSTEFAYSANIDDKTMHELYLWPFADAVRAGVGSIMAAYNRVNNSYGSENSYTLNYLLKNELDFQGFVMSDWWGQHSGVASALAGLDVTMAGDQGLSSDNTYWGTNLTQSVLNGTIPHWRLDDMVVRIISAMYKVGRDPYVLPIVNFNSWNRNTTGFLHPMAEEDFQQINFHVNVQADHAKLIREIGAKSTVLLKNTNNTLPLKAPASIAVIGEDAHDNPGGPNACNDRGCNAGTLAMGWGSGTANYPYLIAPVTALREQALIDTSTFANVSNNYDLEAIAAAATGAEAAIVFVNANSGEAYITVDGNQGDRNNLTLWGNGDALITYVASFNPNTIVVLHTVGPVIVEEIKNNPNVTAILWAGLPGQESGNSITDVLYGKVNPQAKNVFTWGKNRTDWGVDVLYEAPSQSPQLHFTEGTFIDYRHFDKAGIEPSYEFGFGLSYTTFNYSNICVEKLSAPAYVPTQGSTPPAPSYGVIDSNPDAAQFPDGFRAVDFYVYPYLNGSIITGQDDLAPPNSRDNFSQPLVPAGGAPGGNAGLFDVLYTVQATVENTGSVAGVEIPQLYLSLGGPDDPITVLRGFSEVPLAVGESKQVTFELTRRDISNWDTVSQNWIVSSYPKKVSIGSSSRDLVLHAELPLY
ncbi:glycosyl hydrolase family 3 [Phlyctema vagabunda]|uniref:beta-glucosidase n=1 Tax=Phlyctema vagabunda TaxID=108571 RepID=A0ABR4P7I7_9HELO